MSPAIAALVNGVSSSPLTNGLISRTQMYFGPACCHASSPNPGPGVGLRHHRVDKPESAALTSDRGVDAHRCQRGGPKQVDGEPRGLQPGITGITFEDMVDDAADVVAADRLTPRAPSDGLRHEAVTISNEEC